MHRLPLLAGTTQHVWLNALAKNVGAKCLEIVFSQSLLRLFVFHLNDCDVIAPKNNVMNERL